MPQMKASPTHPVMRLLKTDRKAMTTTMIRQTWATAMLAKNGYNYCINIFQFKCGFRNPEDLINNQLSPVGLDAEQKRPDDIVSVINNAFNNRSEFSS